jgi:hypothetical protein
VFIVIADASRRIRAGTALAVVMCFVPACGGPVAEPIPDSLTREQERVLLDREILTRRTRVEAEISRLGPDHAWAGRYYEGDGLGSNTVIWVAPESGCLAVSSGCLGIYGANWGKVEAHGARITLVFERALTAEVSASFDSEYEIERAGDGRVLNPLSSRQPLALQH